MAKENIKYALKKGVKLHYNPDILEKAKGKKDCTYTIEKPLGQGGYGITYLAYTKIKQGNTFHKIYYAIKEFFPQRDCSRDDGSTLMKLPDAELAKHDVIIWLNEFEQEAKCLNDICKDNPHVVKVNEVFKENNTAYYVMEYLDGGSLKDIIGDKGLSERKALDILIPVAKTVAILHDQRIIHCDIKDDNIMMNEKEDGTLEPVLIDFGESRHLNADGSLTSKRVFAGGTPGYAPEEQLAGMITKQVDVYALAATLFKILSGTNPQIQSSMTEEFIDKKLPANISLQTKNAIKHALKHRREDRTATVIQFIEELGGTDTELHIPNELSVGTVITHGGMKFQICSIGKCASYYNSYKVIRFNENIVKGQTLPAKYDLYEYFDSNNFRRNVDKTVSLTGDTSFSKQQFLTLCKKITKGKINGEFREGSNLGWATFSSNNTFYLVDTHYRKPWKKIFTSAGVGIGSAFLVVGAISIYNSIKEASIKERLEMSQRLTHAIINNRVDSLRIFAEDLDSVRAYIPYAKICLDNEDIETAKRFVEKAGKASPEDSMAILILSVDIHERERLILQQNETAKKEQTFDSLYNVAKKQYNDKQYILAKETLNKIDSEFLSRQEVIELLKNIEKYLVTTVNPVSPAKVEEQIVTPTESKSDDELYRDAIRKSDWKTLRNLADKGYSKAYIPLAKHYLNSPSTHNLADKYAQKAKKLGIAGAEEIIKTLEIYEYY